MFLTACAVPVPSGQRPASTVRAIAVESAQVDQLGNLYVANVVNEVRKYDPAGKELGYYSNNSLGNIGRIDVTSPMKVLVFYPAFNTGVILDRRLLETGRFNLIEMGFGEINLISFSRDGTLWIFDDRTQRLYKLNQHGEILQTSEDLRLVFDERIEPTEMKEAGGSLFLCVPSRGILIFDLFGQFKTQLMEPGIIDFQMHDDQTLIYTIDNTLAIRYLSNQSQDLYAISEDVSNAKVLVADQQVVIVRSDGVVRKVLSELVKMP